MSDVLTPSVRLAMPEELRGKGAEIEAVYVHVPFCSTKCHYCDFYSVAGHLDKAGGGAGEFLGALAREVELQVGYFGKVRPRTVFIGGGTPTLLSAELLGKLLALLREKLDLSAVEEFTVEANPNTFDADKARVLVDGGVNRMSFGAQSFHAGELRMLQRDHDPQSVAAAFATARAAGLTNLNVDLIFGIPGQTFHSWEESLARALALEPAHLSCYSLIYEPQTPMTARLRAGDFTRIDEETELAMFEHVYRRLGDAGFIRYETSNYARCAQCQHNLVYWKAGNWLGFGPSAGSHVARGGENSKLKTQNSKLKTQNAKLETRNSKLETPAAWQWKNTGSLAHYLEGLPPGATKVPVPQMEPLPRDKWAAGAAVFWLRLEEGLGFREFAQRTGVDVEGALRRILLPFVEQGFAELTPERARITQRGVVVSDHILKRVLAGLEG